ncbi:hypothetical protein Tco_0606901 [Tanacetum coccineum]
MAREAALKSQRVVHADVRQATLAWTNTNRVNKANQFSPRPVQLSNIRPNLSTASKTIKTGRVNVNTGHGNVSTVSSAGTQIKVWKKAIGGMFCGRLSYRLYHYIPVSLQNQANPAGSKEVIDIDVQTEEAADLMVVSSTSLTRATGKAVVSKKIAKKKTHSPKQPSSTPISKVLADDIDMTFRKSLGLLLLLKHLGPVTCNKSTTSTNLLILKGRYRMKAGGDDDEMPEIKDFMITSSKVQGFNKVWSWLIYPRLPKVIGHSKKEGIDYDEVFVHLVARLEAIRLILALSLIYGVYSQSDGLFMPAANLYMKSTTGGCQFLGRRLIFMGSGKKQQYSLLQQLKLSMLAASSCCGPSENGAVGRWEGCQPQPSAAPTPSQPVPTPTPSHLIKKIKKLENKLRQKRKREETEDEEDAEAPPGSKIVTEGIQSTTTPTKVLVFEDPAERPVNTGSTPSARKFNSVVHPSAQVNTGVHHH